MNGPSILNEDEQREELEAEAMGLLIAAFDFADANGLDADELIDRVRQGR